LSYTASERETVLNIDDETNLWHIYTLQQKIITKLAKANITPYRIDDDGAHYYKDVPYNQVSFRAESKREYTEEQKEAMGERMKIMHEARRNKRG
jgi:hypothetical protein